MKIGTNDISKIYLGGVEVSNIYLGTSQVYDGGDTPTPPTPTPYDEQYLTIESTSNNNTIYWKKRDSNAQGNTISASTDNGSTWTEYTSASGNGTTIATLNSGDTIIFKGENAQYNSQGAFNSTSSFIAYGNIMSLVYGDNFSGQTALTSGGTFLSLFSECSGLTSAEHLVLPATTLTNNCYGGMFAQCTSLTTAPQLSATTLAEGCYEGMFYGCSSLGTITCLATDISATNCTTGWVDGVAASGSFFVPSGNPASWKCGIDGVPSDWTLEDTNGDTYECTGGAEPSTDVPLNNTFAVKVYGEWQEKESMDYITNIDDIEMYLGRMGLHPTDVEELAIGNMTSDINLDGGDWGNCTGLTLAQSVTETHDIHNFPAMQWVNVMASNLEYMGSSGLFSDMNCCPIYVPGNYFSDYEMNWSSETTGDCDGSVADRLVAWTDYFDPNS